MFNSNIDTTRRHKSGGRLKSHRNKLPELACLVEDLTQNSSRLQAALEFAETAAGQVSNPDAAWRPLHDFIKHLPSKPSPTDLINALAANVQSRGGAYLKSIILEAFATTSIVHTKRLYPVGLRPGTTESAYPTVQAFRGSNTQLSTTVLHSVQKADETQVLPPGGDLSQALQPPQTKKISDFEKERDTSVLASRTGTLVQANEVLTGWDVDQEQHCVDQIGAFESPDSMAAQQNVFITAVMGMKLLPNSAKGYSKQRAMGVSGLARKTNKHRSRSPHARRSSQPTSTEDWQILMEQQMMEQVELATNMGIEARQSRRAKQASVAEDLKSELQEVFDEVRGMYKQHDADVDSLQGNVRSRQLMDEPFSTARGGKGLDLDFASFSGSRSSSVLSVGSDSFVMPRLMSRLPPNASRFQRDLFRLDQEEREARQQAGRMQGRGSQGPTRPVAGRMDSSQPSTPSDDSYGRSRLHSMAHTPEDSAVHSRLHSTARTPEEATHIIHSNTPKGSLFKGSAHSTAGHHDTTTDNSHVHLAAHHHDAITDNGHGLLAAYRHSTATDNSHMHHHHDTATDNGHVHRTAQHHTATDNSHLHVGAHLDNCAMANSRLHSVPSVSIEDAGFKSHSRRTSHPHAVSSAQDFMLAVHELSRHASNAVAAIQPAHSGDLSHFNASVKHDMQGSDHYTIAPRMSVGQAHVHMPAQQGHASEAVRATGPAATSSARMSSLHVLQDSQGPVTAGYYLWPGSSHAEDVLHHPGAQNRHSVVPDHQPLIPTISDAARDYHAAHTLVDEVSAASTSDQHATPHATSHATSHAMPHAASYTTLHGSSHAQMSHAVQHQAGMDSQYEGQHSNTAHAGVQQHPSTDLATFAVDPAQSGHISGALSGPLTGTWGGQEQLESESSKGRIGRSSQMGNSSQLGGAMVEAQSSQQMGYHEGRQGAGSEDQANGADRQHSLGRQASGAAVPYPTPGDGVLQQDVLAETSLPADDPPVPDEVPQSQAPIKTSGIPYTVVTTIGNYLPPQSELIEVPEESEEDSNQRLEHIASAERAMRARQGQGVLPRLPSIKPAAALLGADRAVDGKALSPGKAAALQKKQQVYAAAVQSPKSGPNSPGKQKTALNKTTSMNPAAASVAATNVVATVHTGPAIIQDIFR